MFYPRAPRLPTRSSEPPANNFYWTRLNYLRSILLGLVPVYVQTRSQENALGQWQVSSSIIDASQVRLLHTRAQRPRD